MKNIVRLFALSLVVTGAVASTQINNTSSNPTAGTKTAAWPMPVCPPGGTTCGMGPSGT